MSITIATNQQINNYYDLYRENEVVFTKDILQSLKIDPRQIYIKCVNSQWPCIINSTSFQMARIIIGTAGGAFRQISQKDAPLVNLRYCFAESNSQPLQFFVTCKVTNIEPYMKSAELALVTLTFTQRPPDDLILKLGSFISANENFMRRKEERIFLDEDAKRRLGIEKQESVVFIQNVPRRCVLRDLSFAGARVIVMGVPKFLTGTNSVLRIQFSDTMEVLEIKGTVTSAQSVENKKELCSLGLKFDENLIPYEYKLHINNYMAQNRKTFIDESDEPSPDSSPSVAPVAAQ